jgi:hypothetical protein
MLPSRFLKQSGNEGNAVESDKGLASDDGPTAWCRCRKRKIFYEERYSISTVVPHHSGVCTLNGSSQCAVTEVSS